MRARWSEFTVWAVLTLAVLGVDVVLIARFVSRLFQGTLGLWEPRFSSIWALTFLLVVGLYALNLTKPHRREGAPQPARSPERLSSQGKRDNRREGDDLAGPRIDGGEDGAR